MAFDLIFFRKQEGRFQKRNINKLDNLDVEAKSMDFYSRTEV
jgi:hypothetical protein